MMIYDRRKVSPKATLTWEKMSPGLDHEKRRINDRDNGTIAVAVGVVSFYDKIVKRSP